MKDTQPWMDDYARVSSVESVAPTAWRIKDVRNFTYGPRTVLKKQWVNAHVVPENLMHAWFYTASLALFGPFKTFLAHTYLGFSFSDGTELGLSLEARRHENEPYDPLFRGMFGGYELMYVWGTLDDFTSRRKIFENQVLERYVLTIPSRQLESILVTLFDETNEAKKHPQTYHTINAQCANELFKIFNQTLPQKIPWHPYWHITGLSPRLLARRGILDIASKESL